MLFRSGSALPGSARAQAAWPAAKPITYVVPFTAGGTTDIVGRTITAKLADLEARLLPVPGETRMDSALRTLRRSLTVIERRRRR